MGSFRPLISPKPALGPDDIRRRSFAILDKVTAQAFTAPDTATNGSRFCVAGGDQETLQGDGD